jgi:hypothetical protein
MSHYTLLEALRLCVEALRLTDFSECKDEAVWHAVNAAQQVAEEVLKQPAQAYIHCQEFHELAMEYRGTQVHAASTYQRLCDYIDTRIAAAVHCIAALPAAAPSGDVERDAIQRLRKAHSEYMVRSHVPAVAQELSAAKLNLYAAITATKE